ncbi:MAG: lysophospholipid acyltransferase family protein [Bacteroidota bacterium]
MPDPTPKKAGKARLTYSNDRDPVARKLLMRAIELATGRRRIEKLYHEIYDMDLQPAEVWKACLEQLKIEAQYETEQLDKIPTEGPLVFIANHPFGVVDGLMLGHLVSQVRPRFFVLVNSLLLGEALLDDFLLPVNFEESREAVRQNIHTKQETIRRIAAGEALAIFPGGGVATARKWYKKEVEEFEWKRFTAKVVQQSKATVIPIFFHGRNSRLFQLASKINPNLRLSLLINEIRNKMNSPLQISIGDPLPYQDLAQIKDRQQLLDHLKASVLALGQV